MFNISVLVVLVTIIIVMIAVMYLPIFKLSKILVNGNEKVTYDEILNNSNLILGNNILNSFSNITKDKINSIPYIKEVNIEITSIDTIKLNIKERKSKYYAYDKENNLYYKIDETGRVLERFNTIDNIEEDLIVYGITFDNDHKLGTNINNVDFNKLKTAEIISKQIITKIENAIISKITLENNLYKLKINDKVEVIFNEIDNIEYNINFLKRMLLEVGITNSTIDFTKENPIYIRHN